jgi:hypothetical protein
LGAFGHNQEFPNPSELAPFINRFRKVEPCGEERLQHHAGMDRMVIVTVMRCKAEIGKTTTHTHRGESKGRLRLFARRTLGFITLSQIKQIKNSPINATAFLGAGAVCGSTEGTRLRWAAAGPIATDGSADDRRVIRDALVLGGGHEENDALFNRFNLSTSSQRSILGLLNVIDALGMEVPAQFF